MEVMITGTTPAEFNFHNSSSSSYTTTPTTYISAPSTPHRFNNNNNNTFFFSAPTSPTQASTFYKEFNNRHVSAVPFNWEVKPGIPKSLSSQQQEEESEEEEDSRDFAFDFSGHLDSSSCSLTTADELFDDGKIKPLKPPPRLQFYDLQHQQQQRKSDYNYYYTNTPPKSPKKIIKDALSVSPRRRKKNNDFDSFVAAHDQIKSRESRRKTHTSNSNSKHKKSRSLSPFRRASDLLFDSISNQEINKNTTTKRSNSSPFNWYKKWKLKDLLLFRSASEGRATTTNKEHMKKYAVLPKKKNQLQDDFNDVKNSSFRSTDSVGSAGGGGGSSRRRGPAVSAHELHYKASRAISEEMRKKTYLPYKQSLFGCLGFSNYSGMPLIHHELSKGLASLNRGYGCGRGSN